MITEIVMACYCTRVTRTESTHQPLCSRTYNGKNEALQHQLYAQQTSLPEGEKNILLEQEIQLEILRAAIVRAQTSISYPYTYSGENRPTSFIFSASGA